MAPQELPSLRVPNEADPPVDVDALLMNPQRKALAAQFGFGEQVPHAATRRAPRATHRPRARWGRAWCA
eukprot:3225850-Prymnesium_polylepis.1